MLNRREVAMLESLIRRMTEKQRSGLEVWISTAWVPDGPLWETVKALRSMCTGTRCRQVNLGARRKTGDHT
jgi:hypothetical protein